MRSLNLIMVFSLLLAYNFIIAQKDYLPGTIVKLNGEILTGGIDYQNWKKNPSFILFKSNNGQESKYTYQDMASFEVLRPDKKLERYRRAIVQLNVSPTALDKLDDNPYPILKTDTLLLMVLVDSEIDLLYYNGGSKGSHFFYATTDGKVEELITKEFITKGSRQINVNDQYRIQIYNLTPDCDEKDKPQILKLKYEKKQLMAAFMSINKCLSHDPDYLFENENSINNFYAYVGADYNFVKMNSNKEYWNKTDFDNTFSPTFGLGFQWMIPRTQKKLSIAYEIYYTQIKAKGQYIKDFLNLGKDHYITQIEAAYLRLNTSVQWRFIPRKTWVFLRFGVSIGYALYTSQSSTLETHYFDGHVGRYGKDTPFANIQKVNEGLLLGLCTKVMNEHLTMEVRLSNTYDISNDLAIRMNTKSLAVLAGFNF
ncbi:MAG: hypothetical protein H6577_00025 [Lewinellaceae bacterium]|nr:hypothetical protein [Saprospiraceae bacterium]MCB9336497.1 hypothetical protein [Lewinellaceae bacterium]